MDDCKRNNAFDASWAWRSYQSISPELGRSYAVFTTCIDESPQTFHPFKITSSHQTRPSSVLLSLGQHRSRTRPISLQHAASRLTHASAVPSLFPHKKHHQVFHKNRSKTFPCHFVYFSPLFFAHLLRSRPAFLLPNFSPQAPSLLRSQAFPLPSCRKKIPH